MGASFFDDLKADRKMSFEHWRYRLLHWTFGINPKDPGDSFLPKFLYTHYCPLFHLTNLLAVFVWAVYLARVIGFCFHWVFDKIASYLTHCALCRENERRRPKSEPEKEVLRQIEINRIFRYLSKADIPTACNFEVFWSEREKRHIDILTEEEAKAIWLDLIPKIMNARDIAAAKRKRLYDFLVTCVNISTVCFKAFGVLVIGALALVLVFMLYMLALRIMAATAAYTWKDWLLGVTYCGGVCVGTLASVVCGMFVVGFLHNKAMQWQDSAGDKERPKEKSVFSTDPVQDVFWKMVEFGAMCFVNTVEFFRLFYENNCPRVEIVNNIEAELSNIEQQV